MDYKHYYKTDNMIGIGNVVFRHYSATPPETGGKSRLVQYLEGTLTELVPEDFGDITVVPDYFLYYLLYGDVCLEKITFPDSVTTFGTNGNAMATFVLSKDLTIIFPKNVTTFNSEFCASLSIKNDASIIYDFSKATQVPSFASGVTTSFGAAKEIRVPQQLYSSWITAWSGIVSTDKIVAV